MQRPRFSIAGLMIFVVVVALAFTALMFATDLRAGFIRLATLAVLAAAILGAVYRSGERRAFWLGFALLGWGYMALAQQETQPRLPKFGEAEPPTLATTILLDRLYPYLHRDEDSSAPPPGWARSLTYLDPRSRQILEKLDQPIPLEFPDETPLEDVLKFIKAATQGPNDQGITIYVDPIGLQMAEKTMQSPAAINVTGVPLRTTLALMLKQLGLVYTVQDGLLTITNASTSRSDEAFRRTGHSFWALLAAFLGAMLGRWFHSTREERPASTPESGQGPPA